MSDRKSSAPALEGRRSASAGSSEVRSTSDRQQAESRVLAHDHGATVEAVAVRPGGSPAAMRSGTSRSSNSCDGLGGWHSAPPGCSPAPVRRPPGWSDRHRARRRSTVEGGGPTLGQGARIARQVGHHPFRRRPPRPRPRRRPGADPPREGLDQDTARGRVERGWSTRRRRRKGRPRPARCRSPGGRAARPRGHRERILGAAAQVARRNPAPRAPASPGRVSGASREDDEPRAGRCGLPRCRRPPASRLTVSAASRRSNRLVEPGRPRRGGELGRHPLLHLPRDLR